MKKGQETGLSIIVSLVVLILIITQYFLFSIFLDKTIEIDSQQYIKSELNPELISLTKLNADLIIKSIKENDYTKLQEIINKIDLEGCWEIKVNDQRFNKDNCEIKEPETFFMNIPDYDNNPIKVELNKNE